MRRVCFPTVKKMKTRHITPFVLWAAALAAPSVTLAQAARTGPQDVLRGAVTQLGAGRVDAALSNFSADFRTPLWRQTFGALSGMRVVSVDASRQTFWNTQLHEYRVAYELKQGALTLKGAAYATVTDDGRAWRVTGWDKTPPPRTLVTTPSITPGTPVRVLAAGFPPGGVLEVSLGAPGVPGALIGTGRAAANGSVNLTFPTPSSLNGAPILERQMELTVLGQEGRYRAVRRVEFTPRLAPQDLTARFSSDTVSFRYPGAFRLEGTGQAWSLLNGKGRTVMTGVVLPRAGNTQGLSIGEYAGRVGVLHPEVLVVPITAVKPLTSLGVPAFTVAAQNGEQGVLLPCSDHGERWLLLRTPGDLEAVLEAVARTVQFSCGL